NGCICCTVRGDLIRILNQLLKRRDKFDYVMIETTGMADPGPVAQTFFLDDDLKQQFVLDAIITVVDAQHFEQHLDQLEEPAEQVAFADVLLLNKADLVAAADLARIERRVRAINKTARVFRTRNADVPIDQVLNVGAFDLQRALAVDGDFLEPEYPFEWAGAYQLEAGNYALRRAMTHDGHSHHDHDHQAHAHAYVGALGIALLPIAAATPAALAAAIEPAVRAFAADEVPGTCAGPIEPTGYRVVDMSRAGASVALMIKQAGAYALFTEHAPAEFNLRLDGATLAAQRAFASHHHDGDISSIGITNSCPLDANKLNDWLSYLLQSRGQDIFRMKGVLSIQGEERRYVFHGVHMMFDGQLERPWGAAERINRLVFIGRNLDRRELEAGFASAVAKSSGAAHR
ncbi:MAG: GTP-binding protein, partial [Pseudomonadales bacterium]|nr:GTP-binding protein [Pseudomonadales bacterium]